jgi:hypothetical protein
MKFSTVFAAVAAFLPAVMTCNGRIPRPLALISTSPTLKSRTARSLMVSDTGMTVAAVPVVARAREVCHRESARF